ncbi:MAG: Octaprenyl-diphosphate synthase [Syntrophorhabdus sp. PtaB.Bin047]|nr:MAG: Octaprenyl-diphosphate synthase [Syntrophorhabdus sp. PtaB.Bin047]
MSGFTQIIQKDLDKLESSIDELMSTRVSYIKEIVTYIIRSGGKRVRPVLVMLCSKLCGYRGRKHIPYAAIIEFIHTATLLHDDVVDNAKTRRGLSTVNTVWGNEPSVLVGDFLYSRSFELMSRDGNNEILKTISKVTTALSEGEILEIVKTADVETTEKDYYEIIGNKTAVLFGAACEIGAILGGRPDSERRALRNFGYDLGIAFQLMDDVLDYTSYNDVLGKHVGTDLKEGKVTLPLIHVLRNAGEKNKACIEKILAKQRITRRDFDRVLAIIEKNGGIAYTLEATERHLTQAKRYLGIFPASRYRTALLELADYMLKREM